MQNVHRRRFVAQLGLGATAFALGTKSAMAATGKKESAAPAKLTMQDCLDNCRNCEQTCRETARFCMSQAGAHAEAEHLSLLLSCAEMCHTSAVFMTNKSPLHAKVCGVCAEVCDACATSCAKVAGDSALMKACVEACKRCVASCKEMAGHG